jgi:hypothetical protein
MTALAEKRMIACSVELVTRYMTYEDGFFNVYNAYGIVCLRTTDADAAFRRARLLDGIERLEHATSSSR